MHGPTMSYDVLPMRFRATSEHGDVSALLLRPARATSLLVLGHGAGAGMRHSNMESIARRLADCGVATLRYQFPFMERGGRRPDVPRVAMTTVRSAVDQARTVAPQLPLFAGGHSFGGRMTSQAEASMPLGVAGLVFFAFPLHPAGKPGSARADHLASVDVPMLFLSGTRDALAVFGLLEPVCASLPRARLIPIDTADHSFRVLKRSRLSQEEVYLEMGRAARRWIDGVLAGAHGAGSGLAADPDSRP